MQLIKPAILIINIIITLCLANTLHAASILNQNAIFTEKESAYLQEKKQITMCVDPNWMPYEKIESGKHIGMAADFMKLFEKQIGVPIVFIPTKSWTQSLEFAKQRKCDIFSLAMQTKERAKYMSFSQPYLSSNLIIATRLDTLFIADPKDIISKPLGITKGYAFIEILRNKYPDINLIEFDSIEKGLQALSKGKIFGYVDSVLSTGYEIQKDYYGELKIAGKFDDKWKLGVGVRNDEPILLDVFNKVINHMSPKNSNKIISKWVNIKYDKGFDYSLFWKIFLVLFIVILLGIYRHFALKKLIKKLKEKDKKLKELSIKDSLSKLYNRRYFDDIFKREFDRAKRMKQPFVFAMMDIDFFKQYNDTYGHQAGDEAIQKVSNVLLEYTKRAGDYSFRIGGEEFAVILQTQEDGTYIEYFQKICKSVEEMQIEHKKNIGYGCLTISIGVIKVVNYENMDFEILYKLTDEQLYLAKENGRNQVGSTII